MSVCVCVCGVDVGGNVGKVLHYMGEGGGLLIV